MGFGLVDLAKCIPFGVGSVVCGAAAIKDLFSGDWGKMCLDAAGAAAAFFPGGRLAEMGIAKSVQVGAAALHIGPKISMLARVGSAAGIAG